MLCTINHLPLEDSSPICRQNSGGGTRSKRWWSTLNGCKNDRLKTWLYSLPIENPRINGNGSTWRNSNTSKT